MANKFTASHKLLRVNVKQELMETNVIYCGDNTEVMRRYIPDDSVDLIYADPPFFSDKKYEVIWGDGYELRSFEDRWKGGIHNYVAWMKPRMIECRRVLKNTGSIYLHCDWHAGAYLKIMMDSVFGRENFKREIVWVMGKRADNAPIFPKAHETLLFYSKSDNFIFRHPYRAYSEKLLKMLKKDEKGYYYTRGQRTGRRGLADWEKKSKVGLKTYVDLNKGTKVNDIWDDVGDYPRGKEKLGYPTQKPEALLKRVIEASSEPMSIVLDPFCGCGTAIAVAHKLGRRWIGIDVSPTACKLMTKRMRQIGVTSPKVIGLPKTIEELKALEPFEFQNWVFEKLHGRVNPRKIGDLGIDGWVELDVPTQVKQSENIGRDVVDKFETAIRRYGKKKGVIVAFSFTSGAYEEVARVKLLDEMNSLDIKLKTIKEILKET